MKSEIIAVGSEMLTPFRQDTNSLYLTEKLNEIGVTVAFKTIVGDRRNHLVNAIRAALGRTDVIVLMGGLGPTEDDLTREAVAEALSLTLRRDASQVAALHAPGPPNECRPLFDAECIPRLRAVLPSRHIARRTLRAAMIPESQADK